DDQAPFVVVDLEDEAGGDGEGGEEEVDAEAGMAADAELHAAGGLVEFVPPAARLPRRRRRGLHAGPERTAGSSIHAHRGALELHGLPSGSCDLTAFWGRRRYRPARPPRPKRFAMLAATRFGSTMNCTPKLFTRALYVMPSVNVRSVPV